MLTIVAFVVALALLIAVHEYGHYRVAVACGVRVLRFSVGFGKTLWRWQPQGSPTEFVIAAFPLGGYVRMLDEREAPVAPQLRHLAFNTQPLAAYTTADVHADWQFARDWSVQAQLTNLTDKAYETAYGYNQPGRALLLTLRWSPK